MGKNLKKGKDFQSHSTKVNNSYAVESFNSTLTGVKKELKNELDLSAVKSEPQARVVNNAISKTISAKTYLQPDMFNEKLPPLILKMVNAGETRMKISLNPRSLGFMQIEISHEEDILSVKFMVGSDDVKTILENSQAELKQALSLTGLTSGEITVEIASDSTSKQTGQSRDRKEADRKREFLNAKQEIAGIQTTKNRAVRYFGYNSMEMEA
jgi:flagellar hook-length control protein FliK